MKRRVFIAAPISKILKQQIADWQQNQTLDVKWVPLENLHITLVPPWYIEKEKINNLRDKIKEAVNDITGFTVEFDKISLGPSKYNPSLIWAIGNYPSTLPKLAYRLKSTFGDDNLNNKFIMHLTLARIKEPLLFPTQEISWRENINDICLYQSILSSRAPVYRTLAKVTIT